MRGRRDTVAGYALLAPSLVKPLARVVGWPARRAGGVAGDLAGANAVRNPGRTASTAAALMIGLTLVTVVAALGAGITAGTKTAISDQIHADYVVDGNEDLPFRADEGDKLASTQGVKAASHVRADEALVQGEENTVTGVDPPASLMIVACSPVGPTSSMSMSLGKAWSRLLNFTLRSVITPDSTMLIVDG